MRWSTTIFFSLILALPLCLAGCSQPRAPSSTTGSSAKPLATLTEDQQQQKELAFVAKDKLFQALLGELVQSIEQNGPAKSISVCKTRAPEISAEIGKETGVRIGRTSLKLRNAENRPPNWATMFVADGIDREVEVALPENGLGVLVPIYLKPTCTLCHGSQDEVMPEVKAAIVSNYPGDQATGFAAGDLRGYLWVEVPQLDD